MNNFPRYKRHDLSAIFPDMSDDEVQGLADDIAANGLRDPLVLYKGKVLDGWHRYEACQIANVIPRTVEYKGTKPVDFVSSKNWHRRHMTESQRALAKVQLSKWAPEGRPGKTVSTDTVSTEAKMAQEAGVSRASISRAKVVETEGSKALKDAVKGGEVSLSKAEKIARAPKKEQKSLIMSPPPDAPVYTKEDQLEDENAELRKALALKHTPDDEKVSARELIDDLHGKIKVLEVKLRAVTLSRDTLQNENAELKRQITRQRKEIDKLAGTRTA